MKIIEALKEIKRLEEKTDDLKGKVSTYCADLDLGADKIPRNDASYGRSYYD